MAINPMNLMKLKGRFDIFNSQHPKFPAFCKAVNRQMLEPGMILEITAKSADGRKLETNLRLTEDDVETLKMIFDR